MGQPLSKEQQEVFSKSLENVMNAFVEAIDVHIEDTELAERIMQTAGLNIMRKTIEAIAQEQEKLLNAAKAKKDRPGTKDDDPFGFGNLSGDFGGFKL